MIKDSFTIALLMSAALSAIGQSVSESAKAVRANTIMNRLATTGLGMGDAVMLGPIQNPRDVNVLGNFYWDMHWGPASLELFQEAKIVEGYLIRYDIKNDEFEFKLSKEVKVLPGKLVKNVVWIDSATQATRVLVNARFYQKDGVPLTGFLELLSAGEHMLIKQIVVEILKPDFNPALNMGSHDYRIVKHEHLFYNLDKELVEMKSRKSLAPLIQKYPSIEKFMKDDNTKVNSEGSLQRLFGFVATIAPGLPE